MNIFLIVLWSLLLVLFIFLTIAGIEYELSCRYLEQITHLMEMVENNCSAQELMAQKMPKKVRKMLLKEHVIKCSKCGKYEFKDDAQLENGEYLCAKCAKR